MLDLTILFVSPAEFEPNFPTFSSLGVKLICEDMIRKRYVIFRLAIDSDKF